MSQHSVDSHGRPRVLIEEPLPCGRNSRRYR